MPAHENHYFTEAEFGEAVMALRLHPDGLTVQAFQEMAGMHIKRARAVLMAVSLPPTWETMSNGSGRRARFFLHPDYTTRIRNLLASQKARRAKSLSRSRVPDALPTYATGDPTHFDVDHLGRIIYRGPVGRAMHPKWSFVEEV